MTWQQFEHEFNIKRRQVAAASRTQAQTATRDRERLMFVTMAAILEMDATVSEGLLQKSNLQAFHDSGVEISPATIPEQPPVDNAHVAPGGEKFETPPTATA